MSAGVHRRKRLTRRQFERYLDELAPGTEVIMEACGPAHYWGRRCVARDLRPRLLPVQYVRLYVRRNKTDRTDTEAMLEAARCGEIRSAPVKTVEQQTLQALHRVRTQWQAARTARINVVRGLLREQGLPVPVGARTVLVRVASLLEDADIALPDLLRHTVGWSSRRPEAEAVAWMAVRSLFENRAQMFRASITSRLGISVFDQAKSDEVLYSEVRRKAERLWPLWT